MHNTSVGAISAFLFDKARAIIFCSCVPPSLTDLCHRYSVASLLYFERIICVGEMPFLLMLTEMIIIAGEISEPEFTRAHNIHYYLFACDAPSLE